VRGPAASPAAHNTV